MVPAAASYPVEWASRGTRPPSQFLEYWNVIRANLLWIMAGALAGTAAGWGLATFQRPIY